MKNPNIFCLLIAFSFFITSTFAQLDVKLNPIGLLVNSPNVAVEYVIDEQLGIELLGGIDYGSIIATGLLIPENRLNKSGFRLRLLGKYYFESKQGADTWYAGIYVGQRNRRVTPEIESGFNTGYTQFSFTSGILGGYKFVLNSRIIFDLGLGLGRAFSDRIRSQNRSSGDFVTSFSLDTWVKAEIGYRF